MSGSFLSVAIFLPLILGLPLFLFPSKSETAIKSYTFVVSLLTFLVSCFLFYQFDVNKGLQFQHEALTHWLGANMDISYLVALDGISILLFVFTAFLFPIVIASSWNDVHKQTREYHFFMLMLETGILGVFASTDLFLFYIFWEAMLIPMYFIIGIWGGKNKIYAATKFFIYTMVGSLLMLVGIIYLGYLGAEVNGGIFTTNYEKLRSLHLSSSTESLLFWLFGISFFIKVPLFPLHTWLPDAHTEAPTAGSVVLAGVLLKMGTYGLIRFNLSLFPHASYEFASLISILAVIGIIYGALVAMVQPDVKKLVAYSSVSHLGFVVLGIFACTEEALQGAIIQMINHGLSTGLLFMLIGMIYSRRHTRQIADFGGIKKSMPTFAAFFLIATLASVGLPGLNGFIGEFLILIGSFNSAVLSSSYFAIFAAVGVILSAVYMLPMFQKVFLGDITHEENRTLVDLSGREIAVSALMILFIVWIGFFPSPFMKLSDKSAKETVEHVLNTNEIQSAALSQKH
ncbi:proton-translocating NADH-quinone oxidoreductase, chain M [Chloroherpeton thalassium ATCC 35110]|uniref:Proton-translocating NADH-quinone oxidoreductase, chain M n=1 Tax=Chloroherpeton thalassium (strain ATCC 35110 / GB-78) TaxID=517418 RepID=B3QXM2_CHLT3|nr:NADH-quinone oxidoreductase subunit M [Chloroherpeton thalassium]ACF14937.1 proton-translocating NADH-quinone oxidoreductase, chain M [Chloroherpeton thalassium ATCC 35110]